MHLTRIRRHFLSHVWFARAIILISILLVGVAGWLVFRRQFQSLGRGIKDITQSTLPSHSGRTNFVFLGIGGGDHEGPDLTDTIIFISVKTDTGDTTLITLPRDVWVSSMRAKINTAYTYGILKEGTPGGLIMAKAAVNEIINQPVDFAFVVDFSTFTKAIDLLGGIDVNVERSFDDYKYPIPGKENDLCGGDPEVACRYEHLSFQSGLQHMDGVTALKYARSRYSENPDEGSDFARSKRQERVIAAVRTKLLSAEIIKKPQVYTDLYQLATTAVITDLKSENLTALVNLANKARKLPFRSFSLSAPDQFYNPPISAANDYQWVLLPKDDDPGIVSASVSALLK
jgi:LCP family protein required for cell wall assembly